MKMTNFELLSAVMLDATALQLSEMARAVVSQYVPLYQHFCEVNMALSNSRLDFQHMLNTYNKLWKEFVASQAPSSKQFKNAPVDIILWDNNVDFYVQETLCAFDAGLVLILAAQCTKESNLKILETGLNFGANQNFELLFPTQLSSMERDIFSLEIHSEVYPFFSHYPKYLKEEISGEQLIEFAAMRDFRKLGSLQVSSQL